MLNQDSKFTPKICPKCGRRMSRSDNKEFCNNCYKDMLFPEIKKYLEQNLANAQDLAEKFDIEVNIVKEWIREERIEYRK